MSAVVDNLEFIKGVYVLVAFVAVAVSSYLNWKAVAGDEPFNLAKFLSAYIRTAWALVPSAILLAVFGLHVELALALAGEAFGIDLSVQLGLKVGKGTNPRSVNLTVTDSVSGNVVTQ
jgi:hypothetical protein